MTQSEKPYPKEIVTFEKATTNAEEKQVVTVVNNEYEEKAVEAANAYMDAFNAGDRDTLATCINYPHARVGEGGKLVVAEKPGDEMHPNFFEWFRKNKEWNHSCWDLREVIQSFENKVHLMVTFSRYRADGSKIGIYPSIWVMTKQDGHWGIKMRSSFAF
ncbi:MAG: hypothetical protein GY866_32250 [Proteobacteria bacterium]|nr:hypothetical protein [Pseudomonadota bacterium]